MTPIIGVTVEVGAAVAIIVATAAAIAKVVRAARVGSRVIEVTPGLMTRLLGPPVDAVSRAVASYIDFRAANIMRIFENAARISGERLNEPGAVSARVVGRILEEGSWCDEPLTDEYLGGVVASARTADGRDDRAIHWIAVVTRLSTYQIRAHYVIYRAIRELMPRTLDWDRSNYDELMRRAEVAISCSDFERAMGLSETTNLNAVVEHALFGLEREGLIGNIGYRSRGQKVPTGHPFPDLPEDDGWVIGRLSLSGAELFMCALGQGGRTLDTFLADDWGHNLYGLDVATLRNARLL